MRGMAADKIRDVEILDAFMEGQRNRKEGQDESQAVEQEEQKRPIPVHGTVVNHRKDRGDIYLPGAEELPCGGDCPGGKTDAKQQGPVFRCAEAFYKVKV